MILLSKTYLPDHVELGKRAPQYSTLKTTPVFPGPPRPKAAVPDSVATVRVSQTLPERCERDGNIGKATASGEGLGTLGGEDRQGT